MEEVCFVRHLTTFQKVFGLDGFRCLNYHICNLVLLFLVVILVFGSFCPLHMSK